MIETPLQSLRWEVGSEIEFSGLAADDEEPGGELSEAGLYWNMHLYHCPAACHAHSLQVFPGVVGGSFGAPNHDYPAHIEVSLTATDPRGLSATEAVTIYPDTVQLTIASEPTGLDLSAGSLSGDAPLGLTAIKGASMVLSAPSTAFFGGGEHAWQRWSDGGPRVHSIIADEPATYTAFYEDSAAPPDPEPLQLPRTKIVKRPSKSTRKISAWFVFTSSQPESHFRCRLNRGLVKPCRSPRVYRNLPPGTHTFKVFAINAEGMVDPTPAVFRWMIFGKKP